MTSSALYGTFARAPLAFDRGEGTWLLTSQGVDAAPASLEQNVGAVLTKVATGEADAGLVYRTDVQGRDDVEGIVPDGSEHVVNRYPIAALTASANRDAASAFVAFVTGESGCDSRTAVGGMGETAAGTGA